MRQDAGVDRRQFLSTGLVGLAALQATASAAVATPGVLTRTLPRSGLRLPAVGMGTWLTFHVGTGDRSAMQQRQQVLTRFFAAGGRLIDSSPMYSSAEAVLGRLLPDVPGAEQLWSATKVWTPLGGYGRTQMERSLALWGLRRCDLMQVHNLLNWRAHLPTMRALQAEGRIVHLGISTSHGNKHDTVREVLEGVDSQWPLDTLQITYSPADRRAEPLMQLAADRGLGVIINRPFDGGQLLERLAASPLPPVAADLGCRSWAALVLKWELAHPAVTVAIPATTQPAHMDENMAALLGPMPDRRQREQLTALFERLLD